MSTYIPKWHRELDIFERIKPLIIVEGNILDSYQYPCDGTIGKGAILRLKDYLHFHLKDSGYQTIVFYDPQEGFHAARQEGRLEAFAALIGASIVGNHIASDFKGRNATATRYVRAALSQATEATAIVLDLASRYIVAPDRLEQSEVDSFTELLYASLEARPVRGNRGTLRNLVLMVVNKANDLPAWFYLDNPNVKIIALETPTREEREQFVKGSNFQNFFQKDIYQRDIGHFDSQPEELAKLQSRFIALTEGFSFTELNNLRQLCKNESMAIANLCDVVDLYKYGIKENPWKKLNADSLREAEGIFRRRVKGQDPAILRTLDVVKRAVTGLSGLQHSSHAKPKGVLFFAGPTGTGKTETAKTLAECIFGDESSCIRFDMSEYGQSHSDQRLLGAPPGYVGYEAGGQLTNAVKRNPFSILLFDEIEKAHPSILDKFLQILEDGRMTDGQGNTVYFSETVIVFTSNLGIYTRNGQGVREANVTPDMPYSEVQSKVRAAIESYFKLELGRPEILNRIGENIVVFDFIREDIAPLILDSQIQRICANLLSERGIACLLSEKARATLLQHSIENLGNGARGIGNVVESMLINSLSRHLFDHSVASGAGLDIEDIGVRDGVYELIIDGV